MATTVIDTADWALVVPLKPALNLTGSQLTATMTGSFGGAPAAVLDSANGSITWTADTTGPGGIPLTSYLLISVPEAARNGWAAIGPNGLPGPVTVFFDAHRTTTGSTKDEWLGRSSVLVLPGTDAPGVLAAVGGFQAVLTAGQPGGAATLAALTVGPQGPAGSVINTYPVAITQDGQTAIPYPVQSPPTLPSTVHLIVNGEEYFAPDITVGAFGVTWANPAFQLETTDRVVLRYT